MARGGRRLLISGPRVRPGDALCAGRGGGAPAGRAPGLRAREPRQRVRLQDRLAGRVDRERRLRVADRAVHAGRALSRRGPRFAGRAARGAVRRRGHDDGRRPAPRGALRGRRARRAAALRRDPRGDARAARAHADGRAARARRHARRGYGDRRPQPPARATCRCSRRSPRTRPTGTAPTRASPRRARWCSGRSRARSSRRRSPAGSTTATSCAGGRPRPTCPTTPTCGGTCARARGSARSRCGRWTRRAGSAPPPASPRSSTRSPARARTGTRSSRRPPRRWRNPSSGPAATGSRPRSGGAGRCARSAAVAADALAVARPYARDLDGEDALEEVERILRDGGGADRMRAAHAAGGPGEVLARLVAETATARPRPRRRSRASCRSSARPGSARAGSRGWR